jgi:hypothetical protein
MVTTFQLRARCAHAPLFAGPPVRRPAARRLAGRTPTRFAPVTSTPDPKARGLGERPVHRQGNSARQAPAPAPKRLLCSPAHRARLYTHAPPVSAPPGPKSAPRLDRSVTRPPSDVHLPARPAPRLAACCPPHLPVSAGLLTPPVRPVAADAPKRARRPAPNRRSLGRYPPSGSTRPAPKRAACLTFRCAPVFRPRRPAPRPLPRRSAFTAPRPAAAPEGGIHLPARLALRRSAGSASPSGACQSRPRRSAPWPLPRRSTLTTASRTAAPSGDTHLPAPLAPRRSAGSASPSGVRQSLDRAGPPRGRSRAETRSLPRGEPPHLRATPTLRLGSPRAEARGPPHLPVCASLPAPPTRPATAKDHCWPLTAPSRAAVLSGDTHHPVRPAPHRSAWPARPSGARPSSSLAGPPRGRSRAEARSRTPRLAAEPSGCTHLPTWPAPRRSAWPAGPFRCAQAGRPRRPSSRLLPRRSALAPAARTAAPSGDTHLAVRPALRRSARPASPSGACRSLDRAGPPRGR